MVKFKVIGRFFFVFKYVKFRFFLEYLYRNLGEIIMGVVSLVLFWISKVFFNLVFEF